MSGTFGIFFRTFLLYLFFCVCPLLAIVRWLDGWISPFYLISLFSGLWLFPLILPSILHLRAKQGQRNERALTRKGSLSLSLFFLSFLIKEKKNRIFRSISFFPLSLFLLGRSCIPFIILNKLPPFFFFSFSYFLVYSFITFFCFRKKNSLSLMLRCLAWMGWDGMGWDLWIFSFLSFFSLFGSGCTVDYLSIMVYDSMCEFLNFRCRVFVIIAMILVAPPGASVKIWYYDVVNAISWVPFLWSMQL